MEWVLKLEAKSGWGDVETIEVGRLERRVSGLTAEELVARERTLKGSDFWAISAAERIRVCRDLRLIGEKAGNFVCGVAAALSSAPGL